jgi:hypothetical protein
MKKNNSTFKWNLKKISVGIIAMLCLMNLPFSSLVAQTTVFSDDFNRGAVSPGGLPSMTYTTTIGTGSGQTATIPASDFLNLQNSTVSGNIYVSGVTSTFGSPFNNVLSSSSNSGIEWTFNARYVRTTDPSGVASGNYGWAVVLASTSSAFHNAGNGYAIIYGQSGSPDPIRLVKYNNGLQGTLTNVITSGVGDLADMRDYASVRVKYVPSTNTWSLYVRDDGATAWTNVMSTPVPDTNQKGTAVVDNTYTASTMTYFGFYWNHSTTNAQKSTFDNFKVTLNIPSWTSTYPSIDTPTTNGFIVRVNANQAGNSYYVILPSGATAPTSAQVKAGQDATGASVGTSYKGTIACAAASTEYTSTVSGLPLSLTSTAYDVYIVAENSRLFMQLCLQAKNN